MGDIGKTVNHLILEPLDLNEAPQEPQLNPLDFPEAPAGGWTEKHVQETARAGKATV